MRKTIAIFIMVILLGGCNVLHPYRVEIQQGNILDQNVIAQLHLGMDKNKVNALLGSPVLDIMFNDNIWAYVYTKQTNRGKFEKRKLILEFENDRLVKIN